MGQLSGAANMKAGNLVHGTSTLGLTDAKMQAVFQTQLAHMKEHTYQKGYKAEVEETLQDATPEQQAEWN